VSFKEPAFGPSKLNSKPFRIARDLVAEPFRRRTRAP
jgi:hypothetical protein